jgi:serine/threonine protein kinase
MWSLGVLLYEIRTFAYHFTVNGSAELAERVCLGRYSAPTLRYSNDLVSMLRRLLQVNPVLRPTAQALLNLQCVKPINNQSACKPASPPFVEPGVWIEQRMHVKKAFLIRRESEYRIGRNRIRGTTRRSDHAGSRTSPITSPGNAYEVTRVAPSVENARFCVRIRQMTSTCL